MKRQLRKSAAAFLHSAAGDGESVKGVEICGSGFRKSCDGFLLHGQVYWQYQALGVIWVTEVYAIGLAFLIHGAGVVAVGKFCGTHPALWRILVAAATGGFYAAVSLADARLGGGLVRLLSLLLIVLLAFGRNGKAGGIYLALFLVIEALAQWVGRGQGWICVLVVAGYLLFLRRALPAKAYVPVVLRFGQTQLKLTALRDTGNTLRDPISGSPVLILDSTTACRLTGLTREQLKDPVEVLRQSPFPGLRLIPYRTVSVADGLLLGICLPGVRVGKWKGSLTVAFAPENFCDNGEFQALTGGTL